MMQILTLLIFNSSPTRRVATNDISRLGGTAPLSINFLLRCSRTGFRILIETMADRGAG